MKVLRTPDERFANLPGFPYEPHYTDVPDGEGGSLRIRRLDQGPEDGPVVLCMHGRPHQTISGGGHFLQETRGTILAEIVSSVVRANRG